MENMAKHRKYLLTKAAYQLAAKETLLFCKGQKDLDFHLKICFQGWCSIVDTDKGLRQPSFAFHASSLAPEHRLKLRLSELAVALSFSFPTRDCVKLVIHWSRYPSLEVIWKLLCSCKLKVSNGLQRVRNIVISHPILNSRTLFLERKIIATVIFPEVLGELL